MKKSELLMPAGSLTKLKTAILYGADAVYAGTPDMSLRAQSSFSMEDIAQGIDFVHSKGKRIYLTLNLFAHNQDISKLPNFVKTLQTLNPDGVLVADPGVFHFVKEHAPELKLHISTQANVCSFHTVNFWHSLGASLCVLGREVSYEELKEIRQKCPDIRLETFMHGAMCMSYSGRCLISNFLADRSANKGKCAHCCRWHYKLHVKLNDGSVRELVIDENNKDSFQFLLQEDFRPDQLYELIEDEHGSYVMNSKDLCLMPKLNQLLDLGIDSLKVEGRNKTEYYAGVVARAYSQAIKDYYNNPSDWNFQKYMPELDSLQNRGYCLGFWNGSITPLEQNYEYTRTLGDWLFAGSIVKWEGNDALFELRNYIEAGESIEFLLPNSLKNYCLTLDSFEDAFTGQITQKVSAGQGKTIRIHFTEEQKAMLPQYTIARKKANLSAQNEEMLKHKKEEFLQTL